MKNFVYVAACALALVAFTNCKSNKTSAADAAKTYHEQIKNGDYVAFVEHIDYANAIPEVTVTDKAKHAASIKSNVHQAIQDKGGIQNVAVKTENVAADGTNAEVTLTNTYNNGDTEDVVYAMVLDEPTQEWKVKVGDNKEVWRSHTPDGKREFVKLEETNNRDVFKILHEGERDVYKVIEKTNGEVIKEKIDGATTVVKEKDTDNRDVVKVLGEDGREIVKLIQKSDNLDEIKEKVDGDKTKIYVVNEIPE